MTSEVVICNLALSLIGQAPITSIDAPQNKVEQACALQYPLMRDAVLSEVEWSFAVSRYQWSTPSVDAPVWGFTKKSQLPTDVLRVTYCSDSSYELKYNPNFHWVVEGRFILCDASTIYVRTVNRIEETAQYSNLFVQALAARLAMELSILITESKGLHQTLTNLYLAKMQGAATMDGMQGKSKRIRTGLLNGARGGL